MSPRWTPDFPVAFEWEDRENLLRHALKHLVAPKEDPGAPNGTPVRHRRERWDTMLDQNHLQMWASWCMDFDNVGCRRVLNRRTQSDYDCFLCRGADKTTCWRVASEASEPYDSLVKSDATFATLHGLVAYAKSSKRGQTDQKALTAVGAGPNGVFFAIQDLRPNTGSDNERRASFRTAYRKNPREGKKRREEASPKDFVIEAVRKMMDDASKESKRQPYKKKKLSGKVTIWPDGLNRTDLDLIINTLAYPKLLPRAGVLRPLIEALLDELDTP